VYGASVFELNLLNSIECELITIFMMLQLFYTAGSMSGHVPEIDSAAATLSGLLCIGGIGGLASQKTARLGAASGQAGVALGVASTL
jgi:hypothetical protein